MSYILKGNPQEVEKVIRENRIRIQRGVISFTPLECEVHTDNSDVITNLQERCKELEAGYNRMSGELSDACLRANDLQAIITRLKEAGVDIDPILDDKPETVDSKDVPESDTKSEPKADIKSEPAPDNKEPEASPETDTKATKTKRTKKTE